MSALDMPAGCRQEADLIAHISRLPDTVFELRESAKALGASASRNVALGRAFTELASRAGDRNGDGLLMSSEVVELEMAADLVVLSACDTGGGGGQGTGGEALSGLARAFFFAGARNLLVSHWEVSSITTTELLVRTFEKTARNGSPIAKALRQSQLGIISTGDFSHPKAWAGFTAVGHGT